MRLELAAVIPERELWLDKDPKAREAVLGAVERLRAGKSSSSPPDIEAEGPWMNELED